MAKRPRKKHREHTRKPLTEERKQELFAGVIRELQEEAGSKILVEADAADRAEIASDDADDAFEAPPEGRIRRLIRRFARWAK